MTRRVCLAGLLLVVWLWLGVTIAYAAPPPQDPDPEDVLDRAQEVLDQAQAVLNSAQAASDQSTDILEFIQATVTVGAVIATLGGGALAAAGFRTIAEYKQELNERAAQLDALQRRLEEAAVTAEQEREGMQRLVEGQMGDLREQANKAIDALTLVQLGENQIRAGNVEQALVTYQAAYELDPDSEAINYFLGELHLMGRDLENAVKYLDCCLETDPSFPPAVAARGHAIRLLAEKSQNLTERNRLYAEAESHLLRALEERPNLLNAEGEAVHGTLGGLYRRQGRLREAIAAYEEAQKVTPQHSYPVNNLATLHLMLGNAEEAAAYFERSRVLALRRLDDNPFDYWARFDLANTQLHDGNKEEALQTLAQAVEQAPVHGPLESALDALRDLQTAPTPLPGLDEAIAYLEAAIPEKQAQTEA
jgi:tetratricopeptide (TPR) repeat protein